MSLIQKRAEKRAAPADYRERVRIDRHTLDLAAEEQPQLFMEVADHHVMAQSQYDGARDELTRVDARLGREVREKMVAAGDKPTEGKVADYVLGEKEHLDAADKVAKLKVEVDEWGAIRSALEHRKSMIRELATLYVSGYYTAGAAKGAGNKVGERDYQRGREAMAEARGR